MILERNEEPHNDFKNSSKVPLSTIPLSVNEYITNVCLHLSLRVPCAFSRNESCVLLNFHDFSLENR